MNWNKLKCKIYGHKKTELTLYQDGYSYIVKNGQTFKTFGKVNHIKCLHGILQCYCYDCKQILWSTDFSDACICKKHKNIKSKDPKLHGHSIKNIDIKHMLMHETEVIRYGPRKGIHDVIRYVCTSGHPTPEKSTWKLEEVTCKNCLRELKTILHKKDWRGIRKAIYDSQLWDEVIDCSLPTFCDVCCETGGDFCDSLLGCTYEQLRTKMSNGMNECPVCGGKREFFRCLPYIPSLEWIIPVYYTLWNCKICGHVWS